MPIGLSRSSCKCWRRSGQSRSRRATNSLAVSSLTSKLVQHLIQIVQIVFVALMMSQRVQWLMRPGRMIDNRHRHQLRARRVQIEVIRRIVKCSNFFLHFCNCLLPQRSFTLGFVSEKVTKLSQGLSQGLSQVCHKNGKNPQFSSIRRTLFIIISENLIKFE